MTEQEHKVHALIAGGIKICPIYSAVRDRWWTLENHVEEHHSRELHTPRVEEEDQ